MATKLFKSTSRQHMRLTHRAYASQRIELQQSEANNDVILPFEAIPAARRLPFIGTIHDLIRAGGAAKLHEFIGKRHEVLGPIFRERLDSVEAVFVSSPELMRAVFLYEGKYPKHPLPEAWIVYNQMYGCKRGLFFMDGEEWHHNRKVMNTLMLRGDTSTTAEIAKKSGERLVQQIAPKSNHHNSSEIKNLEQLLYRWSIDGPIHMMVGDQNTTHLDPIVDEFAVQVKSIFELSARLNLLPMKLVRIFQKRLWEEFVDCVEKTLDYAKRITDIAINEMDSTKGMMSKMSAQGMSREMIQRIFIDLIVAAGDTTTFSMQWALIEVAKNAELQSQIRNELRTSHNDEEHRYETPLIKATIREAMRLYPVAPFVGRIIATDAVFGHYRVPKNTLLLLSLFTAGRSDKNFSNPLQFSPERWMRLNSSNSGGCTFKSQASLPFAMGGRSCIGRKLANTAMYTLLGKILENYDLQLMNDPASIKPVLRMVTVPSEDIRLSIRPCNYTA